MVFRKAQVGIEMLVMVGIGLILLSALWAYIQTRTDTSQNELRVSYARILASKIKQSSELVESYGYPAKTKITVYVPKDLLSAEFIPLGDRTLIMLKLKIGQNSTDISEVAYANINGTIPTNEGSYELTISAGVGNVTVG